MFICKPTGFEAPASIWSNRYRTRIENSSQILNSCPTRMGNKKMKSISGIYYSKWHHKYSCSVNTGGKNIFIGYYDTRHEAEKAKQNYHDQFKNPGPIDFNALAKNEQAWAQKAHEIIKQLSNRPDAVKVRGISNV